MFPILVGIRDPTKDILQQYKFDNSFSFGIDILSACAGNLYWCKFSNFIGNTTHTNVYNTMQKGWYATRLLIYWSYSLTRPQLTMNLSWWTLDYSSATHASQTLRWKGKGKGHLTSMSLGPIVPTYKHHETFSFMMSLPAINVLCFSRKGGIGGGGWVYQKCAKSTATSGLISRNDLVATERDNRNQRNQGTNNSWEQNQGEPGKPGIMGSGLVSVNVPVCVQWKRDYVFSDPVLNYCWPMVTVGLPC